MGVGIWKQFDGCLKKVKIVIFLKFVRYIIVGVVKGVKLNKFKLDNLRLRADNKIITMHNGAVG